MRKVGKGELVCDEVWVFLYDGVIKYDNRIFWVVWINIEIVVILYYEDCFVGGMVVVNDGVVDESGRFVIEVKVFFIRDEEIFIWWSIVDE